MRFTKSTVRTMQIIVVCGLFLSPILAQAMGGGSSHMGGSGGGGSSHIDGPAHHRTMPDTDNMPMFNSQESASSMKNNANHMGNSGSMTNGELMQNPGEHGSSQDGNDGHSGGGMGGSDGSGSGRGSDHGGGSGMN